MATPPDPPRRVGGRAARVTRTGLAVVHQGELVLPAAGSEAQAERVLDDARSTIHIHIPVEIEVRAAPDPLDPEDVIRQVLHRLAATLENR